MFLFERAALARPSACASLQIDALPAAAAADGDAASRAIGPTCTNLEWCPGAVGGSVCVFDEIPGGI